MKTILIPEDPEDLRVAHDMIEQANACGNSEKNKSKEVVVLLPNVDPVPGDGNMKWTVVDNRDHQAFTEDFETLDGAMIYATDLKTTCEHQASWDVDGKFYKELRPYLKGMKLECDKVATDPLEYWIPEGIPNGGDHNALAGKFVESIMKNVNKYHMVRYLTEDHDNGDGTYETEHLVEITYQNIGGAMCEIDNALESMNGYDWKKVCNLFVERRLCEVGYPVDELGAGEVALDEIDPHVTFEYHEDAIVKSVTVVFAVDDEAWKWCNPCTCPKAQEPRKPTMVTEVCPHCDWENTFEWDVKKEGYRAFCPHCGKELMLCDECLHAEDNPNMDCPVKCKRKGKKNGKS